MGLESMLERIGIGYAEPNEVVYGSDELKLWYETHRWLVWGIAGVFVGWLFVGLSFGGWEDVGHGYIVNIPPCPGLAVFGRIVQLLAVLLLFVGIEVCRTRSWRRRNYRRNRRPCLRLITQ